MISEYFTILILTFYFPSSSVSRSYELSYYGRRGHVCQPIQEEACKGFEYNTTLFPNIFGHDTQAEASTRLSDFELLLKTECSPHLQFFLCTLHFPLCAPQVEVGIPACRKMCEKVRDNCSDVMMMINKEWSIPCGKLPNKGEDGRLCMQPPEMTEEEAHLPPPLDDGGPPVMVDLYPEEEDGGLEAGPPDDDDYHVVADDYHHDVGDDIPKTEEKISLVTSSYDVSTTEAPPKCRNLKKFIFVETTRGGECLPRCSEDTDVLFSSYDKNLAFILLTVFASICFISTLTSVCTFTIDSQRFKYPERPIIFLSLCYLIYSSAYLIRAFGGPSSSMSCMGGQDKGHQAKGELGGTGCTALFFLLYYFGMAASAWWVVLTLTWLLSAAFKWAHEAIEAYSYYYHLVAWSLPAAQTMVVLILAKVDGDELTGVCYVGNLEPDFLMYFVIIPLTLYLLMGTSAVILGFGNLFKIRRVMKHQSNDKAALNLEKLMLRIGLFSVLYIVPVTCVVAVNFYQYQNFSAWIDRAETMHCVTTQYHETYDSYAPPGGHGDSRDSAAWDFIESEDPYAVYSDDERWDGSEKDVGSIPAFDESCKLEKSIPSLPIFGIKIFMSLVAGITSGMWVWSAKTIEAWKNAIKSISKCRKYTPRSSDEVTKPNSLADEREVRCTEEQYSRHSRHEIAYSVTPDFGHLILPVGTNLHSSGPTKWRQNSGTVQQFRGCNLLPHKQLMENRRSVSCDNACGLVHLVQKTPGQPNISQNSIHNCRHCLQTSGAV